MNLTSELIMGDQRYPSSSYNVETMKVSQMLHVLNTLGRRLKGKGKSSKQSLLHSAILVLNAILN